LVLLNGIIVDGHGFDNIIINVIDFNEILNCKNKKYP
jgi:hypothetical protein